MNIFLHELKANFKSLLIWSAVVVFFIYMTISKFSAFAGNPETLAVLEEMPQPVLDALYLNAFNMTTISGFFGVVFPYFALIVSIFAVMLGSDIISKEERDKTVEFSLVLPIPRHRLITAKLLVGVVNCIALILLIWGVSVAFAASYHPESAFYAFLRLTCLALFILAMIFLAIGVLLGCAMKQYKVAGSVAVMLLMGTYFASLLATLSEDFAWLQYFSPFKFFNPIMMLNESRIEMVFIWISLGIIVVSLVGAYLSYSKRDLYI
jgi:ABC-2 type transport system permease protein